MSDVEFRTAYRRIEDLEECEGKVIESACVWDDKFLCLRFADKTYLCCEAEQGYEVASLAIDGTLDVNDAHHMGLIDQAEVDRVAAARKADREAAEKARRDKVDRLACARMLAMMAERDQIDRPTYERMKAEYGV